MRDEERAFTEHTQQKTLLDEVLFLRELEKALGRFANNIRAMYTRDFKKQLPIKYMEQIGNKFSIMLRDGTETD